MISLQQRFDSPNGGISMWLWNLSDFLAKHGIDEFYHIADDELRNSSETNLRNDWHYLRTGVESLDCASLEGIVATLKEPFAQIGAVEQKYASCVASIEKAMENWERVAERTRQQLAVWEHWAVEAEISRRTLPWRTTSRIGFVLRPKISIELGGAMTSIESPDRLQKNLAFFESRIDRIKGIISTAYIENELPEKYNVRDFDIAIRDLMKCQVHVIELESRKAEIVEKLKCAESVYRSQRKPLDILLSQLPKAAQWALFRICRPDLRNTADAEEFVVR